MTRQVNRVLTGGWPGDLPAEVVVRPEHLIDQRVARALGVIPGARRFHLRALNRRRFAWLAELAAGRIRGLGTSQRLVPLV